MANNKKSTERITEGSVEQYVDQVLSRYVEVFQKQVESDGRLQVSDGAKSYLHKFYQLGLLRQFNSDQLKLNRAGENYMQRRASQIAKHAIAVADHLDTQVVDEAIAESAALHVVTRARQARSTFQVRRPGVPLDIWCPGAWSKSV